MPDSGFYLYDAKLWRRNNRVSRNMRIRSDSYLKEFAFDGLSRERFCLPYGRKKLARQDN